MLLWDSGRSSKWRGTIQSMRTRWEKRNGQRAIEEAKRYNARAGTRRVSSSITSLSKWVRSSSPSGAWLGYVENRDRRWACMKTTLSRARAPEASWPMIQTSHLSSRGDQTGVRNLSSWWVTDTHQRISSPCTASGFTAL